MTSDRLKLIQNSNMSQDGIDNVVFAKQRLQEDFCKDVDIIELLNNKELIDKNVKPEDYVGINIFPYMHIPQTQSEVNNFLCFEINVTQTIRNNDIMLAQTLLIRTISHEQDISTKYGISRQDLLAMVVKDRLLWSGVVGTSLKLVYDSGKVSESGYYYREMQFDNIVLNGISRGGRGNLLDDARDKYASRV